MQKRERIFRALTALLCCGAVLGGVLALGALVRPKWRDDEQWEPATDIMTGFYAEPQASLDVLYLGSSHVFCDINPLSVYETGALTGYDLAGGMQRNWTAYYYLREALKTQSPALVVLDSAMLFEDSPNEEARNRKALDYMRPSANKWEAVRASMDPAAGETFLSYVFPLLRFHDRALELEPEDFLWFFQDRHNPFHGYRFAYMDKVTAVTPLEYTPEAASDAVLWARDSRALDYLERLLALCRENGIRLLLITAPVAENWDAARSGALAAFARENGADYADFAPRTAELGLDPASDFYDGAHLNIWGAEKFSRWLGVWLRETYFAGAPERSDPLWDADLAAYRAQMP